MNVRRVSCGFFGVLVLGLHITGLPVSGQESVTVSGTVIEAGQGTPIGGAVVRLSNTRTTSTDPTGGFELERVSPGVHHLEVEALGYATFSATLDVRSDTVIVVGLVPAPIALDSLLIGGVTIRGSLRSAQTGLKLLQGQVTLYPGGRRQGTISGDFTIHHVPAGTSIELVAEALEHVPARLHFVANRDTSVRVDMEIDSVGIRLIARQVSRLAERAEAVPQSLNALNRDDIARARVSSMGELLRRQLPPGTLPSRPPYPSKCIILDDGMNVPFNVLLGIPPELIERIEIFGFRGQLVRVYSKRYVASLMGKQVLPPLAASAC